MKHKARSPLHHATRSDIAAIRALVTADLAWERALGTPQQYLRADVPIAALMHLPHSISLRAQDRSIRRWQRMPHYEQSHATYLDQHLKQYDRSAWEQKQLRAEVKSLRTEVGELRGAIG